VREDDADAELLKDERRLLEEGCVVTMAVKEAPPPLLWRTCDAEKVSLGEDHPRGLKHPPLGITHLYQQGGDQKQQGTVATMNDDGIVDYDEEEHEGGGCDTLVTSGVELTEGKHYWEVEFVANGGTIYIGVTR
jgi:hypothetical protein